MKGFLQFMDGFHTKLMRDWIGMGRMAIMVLRAGSFAFGFWQGLGMESACSREGLRLNYADCNYESYSCRSNGGRGPDWLFTFVSHRVGGDVRAGNAGDFAFDRN